MKNVSSHVAGGFFMTMLAALAGCASSSISVPAGTSPLSHDEVVALLSDATIRRHVSDTADTTGTLTTSEDGTVEYFYRPGKSRFAHAGTVVHERGTWTVEPNGRLCVSLTRHTATTSTWCRFIFHTGTGYGAGSKSDATSLEKWDISKD